MKTLTKDSKIWEVLTEAKKHLRSTSLDFDEQDVPHSCEYVCNAVSSALYGKIHIFDHPAHDYINNLLEGSETLQEWLEDVASIPCYELEDDTQGRKLQKTRKAWINWMIKDCKKKGI